MDIVDVVSYFDGLPVFVREVVSVKGYDQSAVSFRCDSGVTVSVDGVGVDNVVRVCLVLVDGVFRLYCQCLVDGVFVYCGFDVAGIGVLG